MTDLKDNRLEYELMDNMKNASKLQFKRINNVSVNVTEGERCPNRYHISKGPNMQAIRMQSLDIDSKKASGALDRL